MAMRASRATLYRHVCPEGELRDHARNVVGS